jgi:hypothetical protein
VTPINKATLALLAFILKLPQCFMAKGCVSSPPSDMRVGPASDDQSGGETCAFACRLSLVEGDSIRQSA